MTADHPPDASDPTAPEGRIIGGKYKLLSRIGEGGMGSVYRAEHLLLGRIVAIKILHTNLSESGDYLERFRREALVASKLTHSNAVTVFDFGIEDRSPYLVMKLIEGQTLKERLLRGGPLSLERAGNILGQIGSALSEAHRLGIVHRDLKPDNIVISADGGGRETASILDFGIAKPLRGFEGSATLTRAGVFMGTPQYMSPEQALDQPCDHRSDIYTLGVILYEMLTGDVPFKSDSPVEVLFQHIHQRPLPVRDIRPELKIPPAVSEVVAKAMAKNPGERFASVDELLVAFHSASEVSQENRGNRWKMSLAAGGVAVALVIGVLLLRDGGSRDEVSPPQQVAESETVQPAVTEIPPTDGSAVAVEQEPLPPVSNAVEEVNNPPPPPVSDEQRLEAELLAEVGSSAAPVDTPPLEVSVPPEQSSVRPTESEPDWQQFSDLALTTGSEVRKESRPEADRLYAEGQAFFAKREYRPAAERFRDALLFRGKHLGARLSLGASLLRLGQPALALEHFQVARELNPDYPPTLYNFAAYYAVTQQVDLSLEHLQRAIRLYPKIRSWLEDDPDFDPIRNDPRFAELAR